jgi:acetyl esterase/lipase
MQSVRQPASKSSPWVIALLVAAVPLWSEAGMAADASVADVGVEAQPVLDDRYPIVPVSIIPAVESYRDLIYSVPPGFRPLRLDLYRQKGAATTPKPLVIYIHGGGWQSGHTRHSGAFANWPGVLAKLAAKGYVVASIEYRMSGEAKFPAALQDVKASIRWLRSNADKYGIDRSRAIVWGGSAGGHLAALAATTCGVQSLDPVVPPGAQTAAPVESDCVQGLVAWYGIFDFASMPTLQSPGGGPSAIEKFLGCSPAQCSDKVAAASPVTYVDPSDPPALLIHGEADKVVPVAQSRAFQQLLKSRNMHVELLVIPGADHSFISGTPAATQEASLTALSKTFAFIDATVGAKALGVKTGSEAE